MYKLSNFDIGMALQSGLMLQNNPNQSFIDKFGPMAVQAALPYMKNKYTQLADQIVNRMQSTIPKKQNVGKKQEVVFGENLI